MELCIIYNYAQHYRSSIFELIDQEFDCDFIFGNSYLDVKKMDYSLLTGRVIEVPTIKIGPWSYRPGIQKLLWQKYDSYILLGETHVLSTWLFCIRARLFHPKKKIYFWSHGWYGKERFHERVLKRFFFHLPNGGIFLYGNYARDLMIKEGFDPDRLYVIHNSLAYNQQLAIRKDLMLTGIYSNHFGNTNPNLFFVGRLTKVKKLDQVIRALYVLNTQGQQYNMTIVGAGETEADLKRLVTKLGLESQVWFFGPCYDETVLGEMIYNADLCVSPGNVGLTAMHAMVFGTPVLIHNDFANQMPEFEAIHDGETGAFFKIDDISSLADGISEWFAQKGDKREDVRKACMKEIDENWTPQFQIEVLKKYLK